MPVSASPTVARRPLRREHFLVWAAAHPTRGRADRAIRDSVTTTTATIGSTSATLPSFDMRDGECPCRIIARRSLFFLDRGYGRG
jgi:hypothetical protein